MELSYSFHLGNRSASIKTSKDLSARDTHNNRKYANYEQWKKDQGITHDIDKSQNIKLIGSNDILSDIKKAYKELFDEALKEYNQKQKRSDRKIKDYFKHVENKENKDIAAEIIIQIGKKEDWDNIDLKTRKNIIPIFQEQLKELEKNVPNFKQTSAVVHLDETTPHMHVIGIPVKENNKRGLKKSVSKSGVFTKSVLEKLQTNMRNNALENTKKYLADIDFKSKEKGRKYNYNKKVYVDLKNKNIFLEESLNKANRLLRDIAPDTKKVNINAKKGFFKNTIKGVTIDQIQSLEENMDKALKLTASQQKIIDEQNEKINQLNQELNYRSLSEKTKLDKIENDIRKQYEAKIEQEIKNRYKELVENLSSKKEQIKLLNSTLREINSLNEDYTRKIENLDRENKQNYKNAEFYKNQGEKLFHENLDLYHKIERYKEQLLKYTQPEKEKKRGKSR